MWQNTGYPQPYLVTPRKQFMLHQDVKHITNTQLQFPPKDCWKYFFKLMKPRKIKLNNSSPRSINELSLMIYRIYPDNSLQAPNVYTIIPTRRSITVKLNYSEQACQLQDAPNKDKWAVRIPPPVYQFTHLIMTVNTSSYKGAIRRCRRFQISYIYNIKIFAALLKILFELTTIFDVLSSI